MDCEKLEAQAKAFKALVQELADYAAHEVEMAKDVGCYDEYYNNDTPLRDMEDYRGFEYEDKLSACGFSSNHSLARAIVREFGARGVSADIRVDSDGELWLEVFASDD
jgi:hypothetical protein